MFAGSHKYPIHVRDSNKQACRLYVFGSVLVLVCVWVNECRVQDISVEKGREISNERAMRKRGKDNRMNYSNKYMYWCCVCVFVCARVCVCVMQVICTIDTRKVLFSRHRVVGCNTYFSNIDVDVVILHTVFRPFSSHSAVTHTWIRVHCNAYQEMKQ